MAAASPSASTRHIRTGGEHAESSHHEREAERRPQQFECAPGPGPIDPLLTDDLGLGGVVAVEKVVVVATEDETVTVAADDAVHDNRVQLHVVVGGHLADVITLLAARDDKPVGSKVRQ